MTDGFTRAGFAAGDPMKRLFTILASTLLMCGGFAISAGAAPVKVFILAGQSNMEGQAVVDKAGKD